MTVKLSAVFDYVVNQKRRFYENQLSSISYL